jgi:hypothetical protein
MAPDQHRYESCRDRDCERPYCRIWREAKAEGYSDGYDDAKTEFFRPRYDEGFRDGLAAFEPKIIYIEVGGD